MASQTPGRVDVLLIGGGVAAARCARALRRGGFAGSILIVGDEEHLPYNRPPLSKELLRGEVPEELVLAEPATWYERRGIDFLAGLAVTQLDAEAREAGLADGAAIRYRYAVLATGAAPRILPIERAHVLRTIGDARELRAATGPGADITVVGGGFIGVEASASLAASGAHVTLLERGGSLWDGALGEEVAMWAAAILRSAGVRLRLGVRESGQPSGTVLVGIGVEPRTDLAAAAGVTVDDGVVVDQGQRTSAPGVLAIGDVARVEGLPRVEHWHAARESGERAAATILGAPPLPVVPPWTFSEFAGHQLDVIGAPRRNHRTTLLERAGTPRAVAFHDGARLDGVALMDASKHAPAVRALVDAGSLVGALEGVLTG